MVTSSNRTCTCIIPFYNERENISTVLKQIPQIDLFDQILFVDDGSTDNTAELINDLIAQSKNPKIKLVQYTQNKGKTGAIREGLKHAHTEYVFLFDADLQNIKIDQITAVIEAMYQNPNIDMSILRRIYSNWYIKLFRRELILSGQRMLRKKDLSKILTKKIEGYQLETAINMHMEKNKKDTFWFPFSAENTFKSQKRGFLSGGKREFAMFWDICSYRGIVDLSKHIVSFKPTKYLDPSQ